MVKKIKNLNFSYNWNKKLECNAFTSIRLTDRFSVGDMVNINLKNDFICLAEIVAIKEMFLDQINDFMAYIDTGYDAKECQKIIKRMYSKSNINWGVQVIRFILFKKVDE